MAETFPKVTVGQSILYWSSLCSDTWSVYQAHKGNFVYPISKYNENLDFFVSPVFFAAFGAFIFCTKGLKDAANSWKYFVSSSELNDYQMGTAIESDQFVGFFNCFLASLAVFYPSLSHQYCISENHTYVFLWSDLRLKVTHWWWHKFVITC